MKGGKGVFTVKLSACPNPDFPPRDDLPLPRLVKVGSLNEASRALRQFVEEHDLGGGECRDGEVFDDSTGERVAMVSYNGKLWTPENDWRKRKRIEV